MPIIRGSGAHDRGVRSLARCVPARGQRHALVRGYLQGGPGPGGALPSGVAVVVTGALQAGIGPEARAGRGHLLEGSGPGGAPRLRVVVVLHWHAAGRHRAGGTRQGGGTCRGGRGLGGRRDQGGLVVVLIGALQAGIGPEARAGRWYLRGGHRAGGARQD